MNQVVTKSRRKSLASMPSAQKNAPARSRGSRRGRCRAHARPSPRVQRPRPAIGDEREIGGVEPALGRHPAQRPCAMLGPSRYAGCPRPPPSPRNPAAARFAHRSRARRHRGRGASRRRESGPRRRAGRARGSRRSRSAQPRRARSTPALAPRRSCCADRRATRRRARPRRCAAAAGADLLDVDHRHLHRAARSHTRRGAAPPVISTVPSMDYFPAFAVVPPMSNAIALPIPAVSRTAPRCR